MSVFLDLVKELRDKLSTVGVEIDDEKLLHDVMKGLPLEYDAFCSAMRTKERSISCEELHKVPFSHAYALSFLLLFIYYLFLVSPYA